MTDINYIPGILFLISFSEIPKNCHDAKKHFRKTEDESMLVDPDRDGPAKPLVVYCNMKEYEDLGITEVYPAT